MRLNFHVLLAILVYRITPGRARSLPSHICQACVCTCLCQCRFKRCRSGRKWEETAFFFFPVLALMWPSFESTGGGKKYALPAKKINKKQHLALKCSFSREAGGIRRSSVGFTETYEGSLSGRRAHTRSRLIVLTAGKHRRRLPLCVCSCSAEASPCTSETG